jgi:hypothetical protein
MVAAFKTTANRKRPSNIGRNIGSMQLDCRLTRRFGTAESVNVEVSFPALLNPDQWNRLAW